MDNYASGLSRYFQERIDRAKHLEEAPPIPAEPEGTEISVERAAMLFNTLCAENDLPTVQFCVSMLHRFMRQELEKLKNEQPTTVAA